MNENMKEENKSLLYLLVNRKWILWLVLVVGGFFFLNNRYVSIGGLFTSVDMIILLFWISLLLMPFFQEIGFFGFKFKKEIDSLKSHIDNHFINLESDIKNSIDLHTQQTNNIVFPSPPDYLLPKIEEIYRKNLEEILDSWGIKKPNSDSELTKIPDDVMDLFSVRYQIEIELRRIFEEGSLEMGSIRRQTPHDMVSYLASIGLIDAKLMDTFRLVNSITAMAIHGRDVSEAKVNFVKGIAPDLIATLQGGYIKNIMLLKLNRT